LKRLAAPVNADTIAQTKPAILIGSIIDSDCDLGLGDEKGGVKAGQVKFKVRESK
jgi:hypothetical protein